MLCDAGVHGQEAYHPKYMTEQGEWVSDLYSKAACFKDKMDILNYCKKVSLNFFSVVHYCLNHYNWTSLSLNIRNIFSFFKLQCFIQVGGSPSTFYFCFSDHGVIRINRKCQMAEIQDGGYRKSRHCVRFCPLELKVIITRKLITRAQISSSYFCDFTGELRPDWQAGRRRNPNNKIICINSPSSSPILIPSTGVEFYFPLLIVQPKGPFPTIGKLFEYNQYQKKRIQDAALQLSTYSSSFYNKWGVGEVY